MMTGEKRMAGDYAILQSMIVGGTEVVIGEDPTAEPGQRYMCAYGTHSEIANFFGEVMVSDDYSEIVQLYAERVAEQNRAVQAEKEQRAAQGIDLTPITAAGCREITPDDDLCGQVIVINSVSLRREYRDPTHQLKLCVGGFGASPHSRGSAVFCIDLYSGKHSRFERWDVLGTMEPEALPKWAKRGLAEVQTKRAESRTTHRTDREAR